MQTNDYFLWAIILISMVFAMVNVWNYKKYKSLKIENELLKFKLKDCEQRRT
jgi:ribosomal protein S19